MKKTVFAIALAIASLGAAQAQNVVNGGKQLRFLAGMGITGGGDKVATVSYRDLGDYDLTAGGLVVFTGGIDFRVNDQFSLQSSLSYHVDQANAKNGDVKFSRFPIELLAYFHPSANWRVGGGLRYVSSPKLKGSGYASHIDDEFKNTLSGVVEGEYMVNQTFGVKLRFVNEKYEQKGYAGKVDANHVGLYGNLYF